MRCVLFVEPYPQKPTQLCAINRSRTEIKSLESSDYDYCLPTTESEQSNVDGKQEKRDSDTKHLIKLSSIYSLRRFVLRKLLRKSSHEQVEEIFFFGSVVFTFLRPKTLLPSVLMQLWPIILSGGFLKLKKKKKIHLTCQKLRNAIKIYG
jgi:hypothetical protein